MTQPTKLAADLAIELHATEAVLTRATERVVVLGNLMVEANDACDRAYDAHISARQAYVDALRFEDDDTRPMRNPNDPPERKRRP